MWVGALKPSQLCILISIFAYGMFGVTVINSAKHLDRVSSLRIFTSLLHRRGGHVKDLRPYFSSLINALFF